MDVRRALCRPHEGHPQAFGGEEAMEAYRAYRGERGMHQALALLAPGHPEERPGEGWEGWAVLEAMEVPLLEEWEMT